MARLVLHSSGGTRLARATLARPRVALRAGQQAMPDTFDFPTFDNISYLAGANAINFYCDTSRESIIRFRCKRVLDDVLIGEWYYSDWENTPTADGHGLQIAGLGPDRTFRVYIAVNATVDPDLPYTLFEDGIEGPDYMTGTEETEDPPDPQEG